jgi:RNA polymerase subunit RPABC4/transcription elongation factor Spt4
MAICKNCEIVIQTDIVLCCTCGTFCSKNCMDEWHDYIAKHGYDKINGMIKANDKKKWKTLD